MSPKEKAAFGSLLAAILLTVLKLVVGILTNSLAIISEALHSGIDLIAAFATMIAVTKSDKPADSDHLYGHGKIENISSLIETLLLYVTAIWVLYEAILRLFVSQAIVDISIYAILVMALSIVVNYSRSRILYRTAKKYKSQALEADAVHFMADLIASVVVIIGIIPAFFGFTYFDPLAAIGVAVIIIIIGYRIGKKSINSLMDATPLGIVKLISEEARQVQGIEKIGRIRVRESGSRTFIDITIFIDKVLPLEVAHGVTENLTKRIQAAIVESDVVVHAEPLAVKSENLVARIRSEASNFNEIKNIHNIRVFEINGKLAVDFHLELEGDLPLSKAHDLSTELEAQIKKLDNSIASVSSHVEPIDGGVANGNLDKKASEKLKTELDAIIMAYTDVGCYKNLEIKNVGGKLCVTLDCRFKKDITVNDAHRTADQLEAVIRSKIKEIDTVSIHLEPSS